MYIADANVDIHQQKILNDDINCWHSSIILKFKKKTFQSRKSAKAFNTFDIYTETYISPPPIISKWVVGYINHTKVGGSEFCISSCIL